MTRRPFAAGRPVAPLPAGGLTPAAHHWSLTEVTRPSTVEGQHVPPCASANHR